MAEPLRARPPMLRALGAADPPEQITIDRQIYQRASIFKHDSWAATALYVRGSDRVVCKFNRMQPVGLVPLHWLGRMLGRREGLALDRLRGLPGIPPRRGPVAFQGVAWPNAVAHDFIEGRPLAPSERPNRDFFPNLLHLLRQVHLHDLAYVDLHKRENILLGADGRPWLIDFQVCFGLWTRRQRTNRVHRYMLRQLQALDLYHLAKHVRRHRPEQLATLGLERCCSPPAWLRAHRCAAVPLRTLRRRLLACLHIRGRSGRVETELFAEAAFRREPPPLRPAA